MMLQSKKRTPKITTQRNHHSVMSGDGGGLWRAVGFSGETLPSDTLDTPSRFPPHNHNKWLLHFTPKH